MFNISESSSFSFSRHVQSVQWPLGCKVFYIIINFLILWSICLSSSLVHFKNGPKYLTKGDNPGFYSFHEISAAAELSFKKFFHLLEVLLSYFFFLNSFDGVCFQYSWFGSFIPCYFSFHTFHYKHRTFFNAKFHSYILAVHSYCLYQSLQFFFCCAVTWTPPQDRLV